MIEKVNPSHPDKVADRIAGAIVDIAYRMEKRPKIAVEVLIGHGYCHIIAESSVNIDENEVKAAVSRISKENLNNLFSKAKSNTKNQPTNEELNLLKLHILECNKEIKENWGNSTKFIVILLEKESSINKIKGILPDLEKENITILNINNLNKSFKSKEYQLPKDNPHPNAKFWREITPKIIDKLDLN